jgi:hypothetical protein
LITRRKKNENLELGHDGDSKTTVPNKIKMGNIVYWDCPGFGDTKGAVQDIANAFYVKRIFDISKQVKIVLVLSQKTFSGDKITPFLNLLDSLGKLLIDVHEVKDSMGSVFSKVKKHDLTSKAAKDGIKKKMSSQPLSIEQQGVLELLLNSDMEIFREPKSEGPLPTKDKDNILKLIEEVKFVENPTVKITVTPSSVLHVREFADEVVKLITQDFQTITKQIIAYYNPSVNNKLSSLIHNQKHRELKEQIDKAYTSGLNQVELYKKTQELFEFEQKQQLKLVTQVETVKSLIQSLSLLKGIGTEEGAGELAQRLKGLLPEDIIAKEVFSEIEKKDGYLSFCAQITSGVKDNSNIAYWRSFFSNDCREGLEQQLNSIAGQILGEFSGAWYMDKLLNDIQQHLFKMLEGNKSLELYQKCSSYIETIQSFNDVFENKLSFIDILGKIENEIINKFEVDTNLGLVRFCYELSGILATKGENLSGHYAGFIEMQMQLMLPILKQQYTLELHSYLQECFGDLVNLITTNHFAKVIQLPEQGNKVSLDHLPNEITSGLFKLIAQLQQLAESEKKPQLENVLNYLGYEILGQETVGGIAKEIISRLEKLEQLGKSAGIDIASELIDNLLDACNKLSSGLRGEFRKQMVREIDLLTSAVKGFHEDLGDTKKQNLLVDIFKNSDFVKGNAALYKNIMHLEQQLAQFSLTNPNYSKILEHLEKIKAFIGLATSSNEFDISANWNKKVSFLVKEITQADFASQLNQQLKDGSELSISGGEVKTSKIMSMITSDTKSIKVKCLRSIVFDEDIKAAGVNLVIIAPKWEIVKDSAKIDLSGTDGAAHSKNKADNGLGYKSNNEGSDGKHGQPGKCGHNGGCFGGIGNDIDFTKLEINVSGGCGGPGQHGGDGVPGKDGQNASAMFYSTKTKKIQYTKSEHVYFGRNVYSQIDLHIGEDGCKGGDGGKGGKGGMGGNPGTIEIEYLGKDQTLLGKLVKVLDSGKQGQDGNPGEPGQGGQKGCDAEVEYKVRLSNLFQSKDKNCVNYTAVQGQSSRNAKMGDKLLVKNSDKQESPSAVKPLEFKVFIQHAKSEWMELNSVTNTSEDEVLAEQTNLLSSGNSDSTEEDVVPIGDKAELSDS